MSNVRDLGQKIQSLMNMQKVTRAMNMISSIKLRKHLANLPKLEEFNRAVDDISRIIGPSLTGSSHPVIAGYKETKKEHLFLFTADKGLCGTNNSSVLKAADAFAAEGAEEGRSLELTCLGIKGHNHALREGWTISAFDAMNERTMDRTVLKELSDSVYTRFLRGEIQKVWVLGKVYRNSLQQDTVLKQILPLEFEEKKASPLSIQTEPEGDQMAEEYGRIFLADTLRCYFRHSFLSEYSARLTAMENATSNSDDMIGKYKTMQNHARQATITNELIEIVSGKEALKG